MFEVKPKNLAPIIQKLNNAISTQTRLKIYQVWPGRQRFCCFGHLMTGPKDDICQNFYTWCMILGLGLPYMILVAPQVYQNSTPVIPIINGILFFATIVNLILTSYTDPGVIPRKGLINCNQQNNDIYLKNRVDEESQKQIPYAEQTVYCHTCKIFRPPRASHCSDCDSCVEIMDHHCPFVNNCVGKRNYQYFIGFVTCLCFLVISIIIGLISWGVSTTDSDKDQNNKPQNQNEQDKDDNEHLALILIFGIPLGLIGLILIAFFCFHLYLLITGKTTREQLKKKITNNLNNRNNIVLKDPSLFDGSHEMTLEEQCTLLDHYQNQD